jgi:hypothetical protein
MLGRIKNLLGFNNNTEDPVFVEHERIFGSGRGQNDPAPKLPKNLQKQIHLLASVPGHITNPKTKAFWVHTNPYPRLMQVWSSLINIKNKLQREIRSYVEKSFNAAFYLVAFNIALALFARTVGFLAVGNFGLAALAIIPAYIALRSTGPIYDIIAKVTKAIPSIFPPLFYVAKTISSRVLAHCLRVTGIADYAGTVRPGEFFGKANLPTFPIANHDNEVEPNPDVTANGGIYGSDINIGPISIGTSLRGTWSLIKYVPHTLQYVKYGLNWLMKKSGLEEFARGLDTPLRRQEHEYLMSDRGIAEHELSNFPAYIQERNTEIEELGKKLQQNINMYVETFPDIRKIARPDIESAIQVASEQQRLFIEATNTGLTDAMNDNSEIVSLVSQALGVGINLFSNPEAVKEVEKAMLAKQRINVAFNEVIRHMQVSKNIFETTFAKEIADKPKIADKPQEEAEKAKASLLSMTMTPLTPEEQVEYDARQEQYRKSKNDQALLFQKKREESNRTWNLAPAKSALQVALEQEEENKKRMQEEDNARSSSSQQQVQVGPGRGNRKTLKNE